MTDISVPAFILSNTNHKIGPNTKCTMCGEAEAKHIVWNPNKFPGNDVDEPDDLWDVCTDCKSFIEQGLNDSYALMGLLILARHGIDAKELKDSPVYGRAYEMLMKTKGDYK